MKTLSVILVFSVLACGQASIPTATLSPTSPTAVPSRFNSLPPDAHKVSPQEDLWPPVASPGLAQPQPLAGPINSAGAEDSPFTTQDGREFYFFFTPDLNIPAEKQLLDGVSGIWRSRWEGSQWAEPERIILASPGELSLEGCEFIRGDEMWFCSARQGNLREIDMYIASRKNGSWVDWVNAGSRINLDYEVGEMHITDDGNTLIYASTRSGGLGGYDLWMSTRENGGWDPPVNLGAPVNTTGDENRPYLYPDGRTLWFDGNSRRGLPGPAIFRSNHLPDGTWSVPDEIVSQFAGEPNLSADGHTLYFVHHYFSADLNRMIEADIYSVYIP